MTQLRDGRLAFVSATAAVVAAAAFTMWALTASVYSNGGTLLSQNEELGVRLIVLAPLALTIAVWGLLRQACSGDRPLLRTVATACALGLLLIALLGVMTIGGAVLPAALAALLATRVTPVRRP